MKKNNKMNNNKIKEEYNKIRKEANKALVKGIMKMI